MCFQVFHLFEYTLIALLPKCTNAYTARLLLRDLTLFCKTPLYEKKRNISFLPAVPHLARHFVDRYSLVCQISFLSFLFFLNIFCDFSSSPAATSTTTITSQANKPSLPDIIPIQAPLARRSKRRMRPWERDPGAVYLHLKRLSEFRGKPLRVSPSLLSPTPPSPPLLRWQKFIKNKKSDEGGRGVDIRRGWNREANLGKEE